MAMCIRSLWERIAFLKSANDFVYCQILFSGGLAVNLFFGFFEFEDFSVDAKAQCGGWWSIWEHMSEMSITSGAKHFHTHHVVTEILSYPNHVVFCRLEEGWPSRARIEFCIGCKEFQIASDAMEYAFFFSI